MSVPTSVWTGVSGRQYTYFVYPFGEDFADVRPANYLFARVTPDGAIALYFGQTNCLSNRCCPTHHKWDDAVRMGATHIMAHLSDENEFIRCAEESDLIARYQPPLNDQR